MNSEDTDTLLALVSSLLHHDKHDQSTILDALVQSDGNVESAARLLNSGKHAQRAASTRSNKKVPKVGLDSWLKQAGPSDASTSSAISRVTKRSRSHSPIESLRSRSPEPYEKTSSKKPKSTAGPTSSPMKGKPCDERAVYGHSPPTKLD